MKEISGGVWFWDTANVITDKHRPVRKEKTVFNNDKIKLM